MNVNIVLFDDFDTMDAFGPAQIFGTEPKHFHLNYLSVNGGIINSSQGVKVWTELLIPQEVEDILIIPGGRGAKRLLYMEPKTLDVIKQSAEEADICMMIRSGFSVIAQTGLLYHRRVVEYEGDENWKRMFTAGIDRISGCSWLADGKYYSCSSTAASIDMALGVVSDMVDVELAEQIANKVGHKWNQEHGW